MKLVRRLAGMLLAAMFTCSGNLCINASKQDGKILYSSTTVTLLIEVLKLVVVLSVIVLTETPPPARFVPIETFYYAIPSLLYTIDNNLTYVILRFMDPATLSVLWNLKIVVTAVLFLFVLKQPLSELQKIAIVLLVIGVITSESNHLRQTKSTIVDENNTTGSVTGIQSMEDTADKSAENLLIGVLLVLVGVTFSSCASVFTEWAFKRKSSCSFLWQNMQMYTFGIIFNATGVLLAEGPDISLKGFFYGYNNWTIAVVIVNSIGGISMGFILKYMDNIACVYSHSMAMVLTMLFSMVFFSFTPSLEFGCGFTVLIISMYIYHHPLAHADAILSMGALKSRHSSDSCSIESSGITERRKKKQMVNLEQNQSDDMNDVATFSCTANSSDSLPFLTTTSPLVPGLQLKKKVKYSILPGNSDEETSTCTNGIKRSHDETTTTGASSHALSDGMY